MFRNYMKIAYKVLLRRKFFTFISLFGIAFTLIVLNVATSVYERVYSNNGPEEKMDRVLVTNYLNLLGERNHRNGNASVPFLKKYFADLESPELHTIFSRRDSYTNFLDGKKYVVNRRFVDHNYWTIFSFNFLSGKAFLKEDLERGTRVVIINEYIQKEFFPEGNALGKTFKVEGESFKVIGVVENISENKRYNYSDIWIPYTSLNENLDTDKYHDSYHIAYLAKVNQNLQVIKDEFYAVIPNIPVPDERSYSDPSKRRYDRIVLHLDTKMEAWLRSSFGNYNDSGVDSFYFTVIGLLAAFILLPALNLININISRIMERSSEIGVRKSFGASSRTLVYQFVIENIILTVIGGLIALVLSIFVLKQISLMNIIRFENFHVNLSVFLVGMTFTVFFGFISGVLPAYKMAKLNPVDALKGALK